MKRKIKISFLTIFVVIITVSAAWMYWRLGGFFELKGSLLGVASDNSELGYNNETSKGTIYSILLDDNLKVNSFFKNSDYDELSFLNKREQDFLCIAKRRNTGMYVVLKVQNDTVTEIFSSKNKISFPSLRNNDEELIYIEGVNNNAYLYKYDIKNKSSHKIYDQPVDCNSKASVLADGSVLFVAIDKYIIYKEDFFFDMGQIKLINKNGDVSDLPKGRYPTWLEDGKTLFYYDINRRMLVLYDITSEQKTDIKNIRIESQMVISPDKKYIAFDEGVNLDGMIRRQLIIVTVDGSCASRIKPKGVYGIFGGLDGLNWIQSNN